MSQKKAQKAQNILCVMCVLAVAWGQLQNVAGQTSQTASITIDARKVENRISPLLYGQFMEFMFEGIRVGYMRS